MINRRLVAMSAAVVAVGAFAAGAIAATTRDDAKQAEQEVLADAAKRLNVTPEELRNALKGALDDQLDEMVKEGKLTQEQADAIKERRADGGLLFGGPGKHRFGPRGHGFAPFDLMSDAAKALGLSEAQLREQLMDGKSLADIAKARNKDAADVKKAMRSGMAERLAAEVKAGRMTDAQRDRVLEGFDRKIDWLYSHGLPRGPRMHRFGPPGGGPGAVPRPRGPAGYPTPVTPGLDA